MQKLILIFSATMIAFCSCGEEKVETLKARNFYDSVNSIFNGGKEIQQNFIDQLTEAMLLLKENESRTFDRKPLLNSLDQAKRQNRITQDQLEAITEVDKEINYKVKVLAYYRLFENFYEMASAPINLLGEEQEGRGEMIADLILPPLQRIKKQELEIKEAQKVFERKYPLDADGNIRTSPDFEYVRFSDYQYEIIDLQEGEKISLLSYSGYGYDCSLDSIYYTQFIGRIQSTGDTVRILSPCQVYDISKAQSECYFQSSVLPPEIADVITSNNSFIVFNKNQASLEKQNFKTAVGNLQFDN